MKMKQICQLTTSIPQNTHINKTCSQNLLTNFVQNIPGLGSNINNLVVKASVLQVIFEVFWTHKQKFPGFLMADLSSAGCPSSPRHRLF
jgi:hypothetical protein